MDEDGEKPVYQGAISGLFPTIHFYIFLFLFMRRTVIWLQLPYDEWESHSIRIGYACLKRIWLTSLKHLPMVYSKLIQAIKVMDNWRFIFFLTVMQSKCVVRLLFVAESSSTRRNGPEVEQSENVWSQVEVGRIRLAWQSGW